MRIFRHYVHPPVLALAATEFLIYIAALYLALTALTELRPAALMFGASASALHAGLFAAVFVVSMTAMGLYRKPFVVGAAGMWAGMWARVVVAFAFAVAAIAVLFTFVPELRLGGELLVIAGAMALGGTLASRLTYVSLAREPFFRHRVLVYGSGRQASAVAGLQDAERCGFEVVGYVPAEGDEPGHVPADLVLGCGEGSLDQAVRLHRVERIVVAMDDRRRGFPMEALLKCRMQGTEVVDLVSFMELETGKVDLQVMNPSWLIFADGFRGSRSRWNRTGKRLFDLAGSLTLIALTWPIMLLTALAILLETGAPVLYRQQRVGRNNKTFNILKFRSMRTDAEQGQAVWARDDDDRVTRVGRVIRKLRIDELPQLYNVLAGHMSLVGPRPERPEFVPDLAAKIPYYMERHRVRPGITGWAQLRYPYGSSERDALEKLQYDLFYVKNRTLLFDVMILLQTVEVVLWRKGSR